MRFEFWINEATDLKLEYVTLLPHGQNGEAKASRYYFTRTLPTVFFINLSNRIFFVSVRVIWRDKCAASSFVTDVFQLHEPRPSNQVAVNKLSSHSTFASIPRIVKAGEKIECRVVPSVTGYIELLALHKYLKLAFYHTFRSMNVCFWRDSPQLARPSLFKKFLDHTRRTTVSRTSLD
jgi:hypothetical protein